MESLAAAFGFGKVTIAQPVEGEIWFGEKDEKKEKMTLFLIVLNIETGLCVEAGQMDDPNAIKLYMNYFGPFDLRPNKNIRS